MAYHHPYSSSYYPYPPQYPAAASYAPQQAEGVYSDGGYRVECRHCGKLNHTSDKCFYLEENAHRRPSWWYTARERDPQPSQRTAMDVDHGSADSRRTAAAAAGRDVRDRVNVPAASGSSSRRSRSPQGARSPQDVRSPTQPHASRFDAPTQPRAQASRFDGARSPTQPHASRLDAARSPTQPHAQASRFDAPHPSRLDAAHASRFDAEPSSSSSLSSPRRTDSRFNDAGPSRDSGWNTANRRPTNGNEESNQSPRHDANAAMSDPRLRGRKRTFEEGEIVSPSKSGSNTSGERRIERPPGPQPHPSLPPKPPTSASTHDAQRPSPRQDEESSAAASGSSSSLQERLLKQFEIVDKSTQDLSAVAANGSRPPSSHTRRNNAQTALLATRRYLQLADEVETKKAEYQQAEEWYDLHKDDVDQQDDIARFNQELRAQMQKDINDTRIERDRVQDDFIKHILQVTDYHCLIDVNDKKAAEHILSVARPMQEEYRLAFQRLQAELHEDISNGRTSREESQALAAQPAPLQARQGAANEPAASAPPATSAPPPATASSSTAPSSAVALPSSSSSTEPPAPPTTSSSAPPNAVPTAPAAVSTPVSDAKVEEIRALRKGLNATRRRIDLIEENMNIAVEDTHAMQGEMSDNMKWQIRDAVKAEVDALRKAKKRKIDAVDREGEGAATAENGGAAPTGSGAVPAGSSDPQATQPPKENGDSAPGPNATASTAAPAPPQPVVQPTIDLDALAESLLPRLEPTLLAKVRSEAEQVAEQRASDKIALMEGRVQAAFASVEKEFLKTRKELEQRFDFVTQELARKAQETERKEQEMERRENEWKARAAQYEAKQQEADKKIADLTVRIDQTRTVLTAWTPTLQFMRNMMQPQPGSPTQPQPQHQHQQTTRPSQARPVQLSSQQPSPVTLNHPSSSGTHARSPYSAGDAHANGQSRLPIADQAAYQQFLEVQARHQQVQQREREQQQQEQQQRQALQQAAQLQQQMILQQYNSQGSPPQHTVGQPQAAPQQPARQSNAEATPTDIFFKQMSEKYAGQPIDFRGARNSLPNNLVARAYQVVQTHGSCLNFPGSPPSSRDGMVKVAEAVLRAATQAQLAATTSSAAAAAAGLSAGAADQQTQQQQSTSSGPSGPPSAQPPPPSPRAPSPPPPPPRAPSPGFEFVGQNSARVRVRVKADPAAAASVAGSGVASGAAESTTVNGNGSGSGAGGGGGGSGAAQVSTAQTQQVQPQDTSSSAQTNDQDQQDHQGNARGDEGDDDGVTTPPPPPHSASMLPMDVEPPTEASNSTAEQTELRSGPMV